MKVTLLCHDLRFGGIQRVALLLADGLAKKTDLSVDLALLRGRGEFLSICPPGVNVVDLDCTSQPAALLSPFSRLAGYLRAAGPDVVISFGHSTNCLAAWAKLLRRFPFRLIVSEHSTFGVRMAQDPKYQQWRRIMRARFLYGQSELCVCVSQGVADDLVGLKVVPEDKIRVIHNSVDIARLTEQMREPFDNPWSASQTADGKQPPFILSAGRLLRLKGVDTLIRAFARLRGDMGVDARLLIAGAGGDRKRLENLAQELGLGEDVHFAGYISNLASCMANASLFALTSHYEGFAAVLLEALACGLNVVSTDCKSGPREILEDGQWGRLVPVGDVDALALAMREALEAPLPSDALRQRASHFSTDSFVDAYYNLIRNCLARPCSQNETECRR